MSLGYHVIQRLEDDRVLVRDAAERRAYADTVLRIGKEAGLFCFGLPDNHSHVGIECDRATAGRFAQRLGTALRKRLQLPVPFAPARLREIRDQGHLTNAFGYIAAQAQHHGIDADPWLEATVIPDLLGLRVVGSYVLTRVRALLPRLRREHLLAKLGVARLDRGHDLTDLADAAAAIIAQSKLAGRTVRVRRARHAAIAVARGEGATTAQIAELLGVSRRSVRRLLGKGPRAAYVRAIGLQLGLRSLRAAPPEDFDLRDSGDWGLPP
jgi:hypothetical protein